MGMDCFRGNKPSRSFTAFDHNFDINIGRDALGWSFDVIIRRVRLGRHLDSNIESSAV
jgi:hypothetical protein